MKQLSLQGEKLAFEGVGDRDVYNITAPFLDEGETVIAGRVESRTSEYSDVMTFVERNGTWIPRAGSRIFRHLQDPFYTLVRNELVFGGVEVWPNPYLSNAIQYRTVFYRGQNIRSLRLFAVGPQWMKDIRLVEMHDGRIGVFTRPNGDHWGGQAQICFTIVNTLDDLTPWEISTAKPIAGLFAPGEWGGANELHLLADGRIGVLGHISYRSPDRLLHYRPMTFIFDPDTFEASHIQVIAERACFPSGKAKRPDLDDVVFSGGLVREGNGTAVLYAGVADAEAHRLVVPDPFC
ncbi:MAG: DUF1861 family protein [Alicyclobacillus sp.]|nr:DUF1861 family protein [Alicyclobacillus sp.]